MRALKDWSTCFTRRHRKAGRSGRPSMAPPVIVPLARRKPDRSNKFRHFHFRFLIEKPRSILAVSSRSFMNSKAAGVLPYVGEIGQPFALYGGFIPAGLARANSVARRSRRVHGAQGRFELMRDGSGKSLHLRKSRVGLMALNSFCVSSSSGAAGEVFISTPKFPFPLPRRRIPQWGQA